jgi:dephospho-CoA kinase
MSKVILAVVGLVGAGKNETTQYITRKTGWPNVYFGDITFDEMKRTGLEINEVNERKIREEIRAKYGMGAYATLNFPKIKDLFQNSSLTLESFYSWEEYLEMKKEFGESFKVLAVCASPEIRAQRVLVRDKRSLTEEEFLSRDYSQIENLHQAGPIARADFTLTNESTKEDLYKAIEVIIKKLLT